MQADFNVTVTQWQLSKLSSVLETQPVSVDNSNTNKKLKKREHWVLIRFRDGQDLAQPSQGNTNTPDTAKLGTEFEGENITYRVGGGDATNRHAPNFSFDYASGNETVKWRLTADDIDPNPGKVNFWRRTQRWELWLPGIKSGTDAWEDL